VNDLIKHTLEILTDSDMVGITIHNRVNQNDKVIEHSFRLKDQLVGDMIWSLFEKVSNQKLVLLEV